MFINFGINSKNRSENTSVQINNQDIKSVISTKYHGIIVDQMKWELHANDDDEARYISAKLGRRGVEKKIERFAISIKQKILITTVI